MANPEMDNYIPSPLEVENKQLKKRIEELTLAYEIADKHAKQVCDERDAALASEKTIRDSVAAVLDRQKQLSLACETFQHASDLALADAAKAERKCADLRSELMEERNHREKAENIARTAAKQRDELRGEAERLFDCHGAFCKACISCLHEEIARLRDEKDSAQLDAKASQATNAYAVTQRERAERRERMYAEAWHRELGQFYRPKMYEIDALVVATQRLVASKDAETAKLGQLAEAAHHTVSTIAAAKDGYEDVGGLRALREALVAIGYLAR